MLKSLPTVWKKWRAAQRSGQQIDALLANADPKAALATRNQWLIEIAHWLHRGGSLPVTNPVTNPVATEVTAGAGADVAGVAAQHAQPAEAADPRFPPHTRLRYLLQLLERNPQWKERCARALRQTLSDSDTASLLCESGMPAHSGFLGALVERIQTALIPPAPNSRDLGALFTLMFTSADDAQWVAALPPSLLEPLGALLTYRIEPDEKYRLDLLSLNLLDAIQALVCQVSATGLSHAVRTRLTPGSLDESPFFQLGRAMLAIADTHHARDPGTQSPQPLQASQAQVLETQAPQPQVSAPDERALELRLLQQVNYLRVLLDRCRASVREIYAHLDENGVSVEIVFQIERMQARLARIEQLLEAWLAEDGLKSCARLLAELIVANRASHSIAHLLRSSFGMLARKMVESSAQTGEHYIARDRDEYLTMLKMAAGGGIVTAATVYIKFGVTGAHLQPMVEGFLAGMNYALSFLLMHFLHFTLATKQPAMTAPTIAHALDQAGTPEGLEHFVSSVIALVRTQAAAIFGNLMLVFPVCLAAQLGWSWLFHADLISPEKAHYTLKSFSLLGATPVFAALTGVLLWSSSLLSGWAENWYALHRLGDVLAYNRRLRMVFGESGAARIAAFWDRNLSGIVGNLSLGLMLGLVPAVLTAFALPFEVRHVTLSTGSIAVAIGVLGMSALDTSEFWWAVAGTASMAVLNVSVSFALAFQMAVRSRGLRTPDRRALNRVIWHRILTHPLSLLFPPAAARIARHPPPNAQS